MITQVTDVNHVLLDCCHHAAPVPALDLIQPRTPGWWGPAAAAMEMSLTPRSKHSSWPRSPGHGALGRVPLFRNKRQLGGLFVWGFFRLSRCQRLWASKDLAVTYPLNSFRLSLGPPRSWRASVSESSRSALNLSFVRAVIYRIHSRSKRGVGGGGKYN